MVKIKSAKDWKSFLADRSGFKMAASIAFAALLIFAAIHEKCGDLNFDLASGLPTDMATSPVAQKLIENKIAGGGEIIEPDAIKSTGRPASIGSEKTDNEEIGDEKSVAVASASKTILAANDSNDRRKENLVVISKIGVSAPIIISNTVDNAKLHSLLDMGAVLYPGSVFFGQKGQTILLGHSAPANWPKIKHDTIFSNLIELGSGDEIIVTYEEKTYYYSVNKTQIIDKGGDVPQTNVGDNSLVLVSCWPPGRDLKRIAVEASLIKTE